MARTFEDDPIAFPHLPGILATLAEVMEEDRLPAVCTSSAAPGALVALDYLGDDCDSFAWCRVSGVFPSMAFPNPDATPQPVLIMATTIELGLMRTFEIPDNGVPVEAETLYESTRLQMADMRAMLEALCRYGSTMPDERILVGQYTPLGPAGGVLGGTWSATLPQRL